MGRIDKESYYLDIAETVLERSTCSRSHSGALIVRTATASTSATASANGSASPPASATSSAAASTPR